jgi:hypothetical protein
MTPNLVGAKDAMIDTVLPRAKDTLDTVLPRAKATGVGLAVRAGLVAPPKKRHPWRTAALVGAAAVGAYAAWNAWRLPHASEGWAYADGVGGTVLTDDRTAAAVPGVAADSSPTTF